MIAYQQKKRRQIILNHSLLYDLLQGAPNFYQMPYKCTKPAIF